MERTGQGGLLGVAVEQAHLDAFPYKPCEKHATISQASLPSAPGTHPHPLHPLAPAAGRLRCFATLRTLLFRALSLFFNFLLNSLLCFADYLFPPLNIEGGKQPRNP